MNLLTSGDITKSLNIGGLKVDRDAVSYALRKGKIQPVGRAGIVRLFPGTAVSAVKDFLDSKRKPTKECVEC